MKTNLKRTVIAFGVLLSLSLSIMGVSAATYSKTKSFVANYGEQISVRIHDKATKNTTSGDWSFSFSVDLLTSKNGYRFGRVYTSSAVKTNNGNKVAHKVGYYFFNSLGNSTGGGIKELNFSYSNGAVT